MKTLIALYAGNNAVYQFQKLFDGKSAIERNVLWAHQFPESSVVLFADSENQHAVEDAIATVGSIDIVSRDAWSIASLTAEMSACAKKCGAQTVLFALSSAPFYDEKLASDVLAHHVRYTCEYTFADGYAGGLAPAAVDSGALALIASLANRPEQNFCDKAVTATALFDVIKGDINSFEVETIFAEEDLRQFRFDFSCLSKRTTAVCKTLFELAKANDAFDAATLGQLAKESRSVQRTIPSFYNIQISPVGADSPIYTKENAVFRTMDSSAFKKLLAQIDALSGEAVISLSAWGEPLSHPDFLAFVESALAYPALSLLIETNGALMTPALAEECAALCAKAAKRTNGHEAIYWIVFIDAMDEETYQKIHRTTANDIKNRAALPDAIPTLAKAKAAVETLQKAFPLSVYPQFMRMNENEHQLESFYRYYKEQGSKTQGNLIVQKYDWFCGDLPDRRPADLAPLERNPCWHLVRDMVILADGSSPPCRECTNSLGNVFTEGLAAVWERGGQEHARCGKCDEYYTFNF